MTDAIQATFCSIRHVQGRKVYQLIFEIAQEQADHALAVLGGVPKSDDPVWCGIVRLNKESVTQGTDAGPARAREAEDRLASDPTSAGEHGVQNRGIASLPPAPSGAVTDGAHKARRRFSEMPRSQQAGMLCADPRFIHWAGFDDGPDHVADWLREHCHVTSRSELLPGTVAAGLFDEILMRYLKDTGQMAEERS